MADHDHQGVETVPDPTIHGPADDEAATTRVEIRGEALGATVETAGGRESRGSRPAEIDRQIGPYRLLELLGEGGMGTVYLAEQRKPLERRVALKLMHGSVGGAEALRRFELERHALARMSHPSIAQVYGAGSSHDGVPYVALEYVDGAPITRFCDERALGLRQRLELFVEVCRGVRHAHERSIIHRDLKPSNILVTEVQGEPRPKIIDFGIAKSLEANAAAQTGIRHRVGTPAYSSPETFAATRAVDPRADVFSLGVVLCELVAGVRPFKSVLALVLAGDAPLGSLGAGLEGGSAARPSRRLSALPDDELRRIAAARDLRPQALLRALRDDLDWVVARAIALDPDERYGSVAELAADVERWLTDRPVAARPASLPYRLRKALRRHAVAAVAAAVVLLTTVGFSAYSWRQSARADDARRQAESLVAFMLEDLSLQLEPMGRLDLLESVSRRSLAYFEAADERDHRVDGLPSAALRQSGRILLDRGDSAAAREAFERAREIDRRRVARDPLSAEARLDLAHDLSLLGRVQMEVREYGAARRAFDEALASLPTDDVSGRDEEAYRRAQILAFQGELARYEGRPEESRDLNDRAIEVLEPLLTARPDSLEIRYALANARYGRGLMELFAFEDPAAAALELEEAARHVRELLESRPEAARWRYRLAVILGQGLSMARADSGRLAEALEANAEARSMFGDLTRRDPGNERWAHAYGWELYRGGELARSSGDLETASARLRQAQAVHRGVIERSPSPPVAWLEGYAFASDTLADVELERGRLDAAHQAADEAAATWRRLSERADTDPRGARDEPEEPSERNE